MTQTLKSEPYDLFHTWFAEAEKAEPNDPNAMALATVGADGRPTVRMVLLKDADERGFVFYTNYESRKGRQLLETHKAAIVLHWKTLGRQVRVEGDVQSVTEAEADEYFHSRHRSSQIGAWASQQSRPLESRFELEKRVALFAAKYAIGTVPRPPYWSGFRIVPDRIEFWENKPFRLHDRLVYSPSGDGWTMEKLYP
jgi:pyridoxamine 5'-phosphate oxidase